MLNQPAPDKRLDDVILRRNQPCSTSRYAIDRLVDPTLQRIDVVNRILLAGGEIQPPLIIGREASLFGSQLPRKYDRVQHLLVRGREVGKHGLRDVVESSTRQHAPVHVSGLQGDAVGAGVQEGLLRAVPAVDGLPVVGPYVPRVGADDGRVEEAAGCGAVGEVDGEEGAVFGFVSYKGEAVRA